MTADDVTRELGPPAVLFAILDAARALPPARRGGPFHGIGGSDDRGEDGLWLAVRERELFLTDDEAGALIAGDYIEVSPASAGNAAVRILERSFDAHRSRGSTDAP